MKRYFISIKSLSFLLLLLISLVIGGCVKKEKTYSPEEFKQAMDSILQQKAVEIKKQGKKDLDLRSSIELKPMVDSILHRTPTIDPLPVLDTSDNNSNDTGIED